MNVWLNANGIAYNLSSNVEGREIFCDPDYMELIVNNLLIQCLQIHR